MMKVNFRTVISVASSVRRPNDAIKPRHSARALLHRFSYRSIARAHGTPLAIARVSLFRKKVIYVELDLLLRDRA
jgi:hypothetical protein